MITALSLAACGGAGGVARGGGGSSSSNPPSAPTGVSASAGNAQVTVSWTAVAGATSYNLYYRTTTCVAAGNGTKITGATSGSAVTGLTNGTTYYFVVTAVNAGGESAVSNEANATPQVPAPGAPTGVSAAAGNAQVTVNWTAVAGAASYNVYYRTTTGVTAANGTKITGATSGSAVTRLTNNTAYYFVVTAVNAGGESAVSNEANATPQVPVPGAPTGVSASAGSTQVMVSWTAVAGATSYNVYYRMTAGVTAANGTKITDATSGSAVIGLANGSAYYFVVTAISAGGESGVSSEVNATPVPVVQKVPDTGQITCYSATGSVISCTGAGEDGSYTINAPSYTDNGNGTITDNVTGMMWQKQDDGTTRDWAAAGTYCTGLRTGGYSDWRLPSKMDLVTIANSETDGPSIIAVYFPNNQLSVYWSSTIHTSITTRAWNVNFSGVVASYPKTNVYYVRCVRLGQSTAQNFTDNGNGTVTDNVTTLMWQKQYDGTRRTWEAAITYCEGLSLGGYTDWRLPNYKELSSILDDTLYDPSINTTYFPATQSSSYWSSTTQLGGGGFAWVVYFYNSSAYGDYKANVNPVRCVRLGQ